MYQIHTVYDRTSHAALFRALEKTFRRRSALLFRVFGWILAAVLLAAEGVLRWVGAAFDFFDVLVVLIAVLWAAFLLKRDAVMGWLSERLNMASMREADASFSGTEYVLSAATAAGHWQYAGIRAVCETERYFLFLLDKRHGQVFDKTGFTKGTPEEFRTFMQEKTGLPVQSVK